MSKLDTKSKSDASLKEQTDKFEAYFVKQILDIAMNSEEENGLYPKDAGDKIYKSMYNDTMSTALSGNLGLSQMLFTYLKEGR
nr:rod-binding protein [Sulfurospirillum arsenophilum]